MSPVVGACVFCESCNVCSVFILIQEYVEHIIIVEQNILAPPRKVLHRANHFDCQLVRRN